MDSERQRDRFHAAYSAQRVCVTGGAGFIGSRLVHALLELGAGVRIIDDLSTGTLDAVADAFDRYGERVEFVQASVLDPSALADATDSARVVFHLAAIGSVGESLRHPQRVFDVNSAGTVRTLRAAKYAGAGRVVLAASSAAYGAQPPPHAETMLPDPLSVYAASKLAAEHAVAAFSRSLDLPGVCLRFFNVYGPGQRGDEEGGVVARFVDRLLEGRAPTVFGDGTQTRDFVYVDDAIDALLAAGATDHALTGQAVNVGTGRETTINDLARTLADLTEQPHLTPELELVRAGDVPRSFAETSEAESVLDFRARVELTDGLKRTIDSRPRPARTPEPA